MIWASISRLMRIVGGTVRFTDRFADTLPRRQSRASEARSAGSNPSNPGGSRNRRSSERLLTLFSSQAQEIPSASPSVRANPVMLKTLTAASLLLPASGYTDSPPGRQCRAVLGDTRSYRNYGRLSTLYCRLSCAGAAPGTGLRGGGPGSE